MNLKDLNFSNRLDTSSSDLTEDFFVPALSATYRYDRGVGFFSSGWIKITSKGLIAFAANGGKARWVTSPILSEEDWQALKIGDEAKYDPVLRASLQRNISDLERALEKDSLSALAWMVADGILSFQIGTSKK